MDAVKKTTLDPNQSNTNKKDVNEGYRFNDTVSFYSVIEVENENGPTEAVVSEHTPQSFAAAWGAGEFEFRDVLAHFLDEKKAQNFAEKHNRDTISEINRIEEKKSTTVNKLRSSIDKLEKQRKQRLEAIKANPKDSSQHREAIAQITTKIDDLVTKMERVEIAKKPIQDEVDPKKKLNESTQPSIDNHPWIKNSFRTLVENLQAIQKHPKYTLKDIMYYINDFLSTVRQVKNMTKNQ